MSNAQKVPAKVQAALNLARSQHAPVAVIVRLGNQADDPGSKRECLEKVIQAATDITGQVPLRKSLFPNLGSMAIEGNAEFVETLLNDSHIASVSLNNPPTKLEPIRPVEKRTPIAGDWSAASPSPKRDKTRRLRRR